MAWIRNQNYGGYILKKIFILIKTLFGKYETGFEYWIYTKDIKVNPQWRKPRIRKNKFIQKLEYWYRTGEFESNIILDKNFNLLDGYSSLRIAEIKGIDKVPAYFVD